MKKKGGFTLTELIIVAIAIGIIAGFAVPNYIRLLELAHQKEAIDQLTQIHAAEQIYRIKNNSYWPWGSAWDNLDYINRNLNLKILSNGMTYTCRGNGTGVVFTCRAVRQAPATSFTITVTQAAISSTNPSCTAGTCP